MELVSKVRQILQESWEQDNLHRLLFLTIAVSLVAKKFAPILLVLIVLLAIYERLKGRIASPIQWTLPLILMVLFFVVHVIGFGWSYNMAYAKSDLEIKAAFVIVPLVFWLANFTVSINRLVNWLIFVLVLANLGLNVFALFKSIVNPEDNHFAYFTESYFSQLMHRSYWATYCAIAAVWSLVQWWKNSNGKAWYLFAFLMLSSAVIQTASKAGVIIFALLFVAVLVQMIFTSSNRRLKQLALVLLLVIPVLFTVVGGRLTARFAQVFGAIGQVETVNNPSTESNAARIIMWSTSTKIIQERFWLGTGTGDVKDVLTHTNWKLHNTGVARSQLNAHNQFLNTWVQLGVIGFLALIGLFISVFFMRTADTDRWFSRLFIAAIFISCLFESFIETQAGIMPVCLLIAAFAASAVQPKKASTLKNNKGVKGIYKL